MMFLLSFCFSAAALSFSRVVVVAVVLVEGVVVVVVCVAPVPLLQNAHLHVAACIRECTATSSSCVSCMMTRSHAIIVLHVFLLVTAHSY